MDPDWRAHDFSAYDTVFHVAGIAHADVAVRALATDSFHVIVLRPPMIFGKGSKGNYPTLAKLANALPIFPDVTNERSMLYIGNLCELLCQTMLVTTKQQATVLIPQNPTWVRTCDLVREICRANKKHILTLKILNPFVVLAGKVPGKISGLVHKAFGNNCYDHALSNYEGITYQRFDLVQSVEMTER